VSKCVCGRERERDREREREILIPLCFTIVKKKIRKHSIRLVYVYAVRSEYITLLKLIYDSVYDVYIRYTIFYVSCCCVVDGLLWV
jgi:hypothetical protein